MSAWTIRLTDQAAQDIEEVLDWTLEQFGPLQMGLYGKVISDALAALYGGPQLIDVCRQPELGDGVSIRHVARQGRKGRHLLIFRAHEQECVIEVLRILHDSMGLLRHLD